jgi:hypothetical protein
MSRTHRYGRNPTNFHRQMMQQHHAEYQGPFRFLNGCPACWALFMANLQVPYGPMPERDCCPHGINTRRVKRHQNRVQRREDRMAIRKGWDPHPRRWRGWLS